MLLAVCLMWTVWPEQASADSVIEIGSTEQSGISAGNVEIVNARLTASNSGGLALYANEKITIINSEANVKSTGTNALLCGNLEVAANSSLTASGYWPALFVSQNTVIRDASVYAESDADVGIFNQGGNLEIAGSTVEAVSKKGSGGIVIRADWAFGKFVSVLVDGTEIGADCYTAEAGSTIITLKPEYVNTLSPGNHIIGIRFTDGLARTRLTLKEKKDPSNPPANQQPGGSDGSQPAGAGNSQIENSGTADNGSDAAPIGWLLVRMAVSAMEMAVGRKRI